MSPEESKWLQVRFPRELADDLRVAGLAMKTAAIRKPTDANAPFRSGVVSLGDVVRRLLDDWKNHRVRSRVARQRQQARQLVAAYDSPTCDQGEGI